MNSNPLNNEEPDEKTKLTNKVNIRNEMSEDKIPQKKESEFKAGEFKMGNSSLTEKIIKDSNEISSLEDIIEIISTDPDVEIVLNDQNRVKNYKKIKIPLLRKLSTTLLFLGFIFIIFGLIVTYVVNIPTGLKEAIPVQARITLVTTEMREVKSITSKGIIEKDNLVCRYQYDFVVGNMGYGGNTEIETMFGDKCMNEGELLPFIYEKRKPEINKLHYPNGKFTGNGFVVLGAFMFLFGFLVKRFRPHIEIR